jgi:hypothetical protein
MNAGFPGLVGFKVARCWSLIQLGKVAYSSASSDLRWDRGDISLILGRRMILRDRILGSLPMISNEESGYVAISIFTAFLKLLIGLND